MGSNLWGEMKNAPLQIGVAFVCSRLFYPKTVENGGLFGVDTGDDGEGTLVWHHDTVCLNEPKLS